MLVYHGSSVRVERPLYGVGNSCNDYGLGFYCTEVRELACEWACPLPKDGFVNAYELDVEGLSLFDFDEEPVGTLGWLAVLLSHRQFDIATGLMERAKQYVLEFYPKSFDKADVVAGYRADDSYFSFARAFLDNRISLRQLERAMRLGGLGRQVVLKSPQAFGSVRFVDAEVAPASLWHERRVGRDRRARSEFRRMLDQDEFAPEDVFVIDLIRKS